VILLVALAEWQCSRPASNKQQTKVLPITAANPHLRPLALALQLQQIQQIHDKQEMSSCMCLRFASNDVMYRSKK
jgi:hypothetical protein